MRYFLIVLALLVGGCATTAVKSAPQYRVAGVVDGVEVRVYQTRRDFLAGVPAHVAALQDAMKRVAPGTGTVGYYDWKTKVIHLASASAVMLVHEVKHHLEPNWYHGFTPTPEDQGWRQVGVNKIFILKSKEFPVRDGETIDSVIIRLKEFLK